MPGLEEIAQASKGAKAEKMWFPLESNPEVMSQYCERLGLDASSANFVDILSTDDWALEMVPRPVLGVLMVFPISEKSEAHRAEEKARIEKDGQTVSDEIFYTKQYVGNACGTIGLMHAVLNARQQIRLKEGSWFERFAQNTVDSSPQDTGRALEDDTEIEEAHVAAAAVGQSEVIEETNAHFVCFSCVAGSLYELDGRKDAPINHGPSSPSSLLEDACRVVKQFMERDPEEMRFSLVALTQVTV